MSDDVEALTQIMLGWCGLLAMWWAMGANARLRRWAPVLGLFGQIFWFAFAWAAAQKGVNVRGLVGLCCCYTLVYARGVLVQWRPTRGDA